MKKLLLFSLGSALTAVPPLPADESAAPAAPRTNSPAAQAATEEKIPSPETAAARILAFMTGVRQAMAGVQDTAGADKAAETLKGIQEEILENNRLLMDYMNRGILKQDELAAALDRMEKQGKEEKKLSTQEMLRLRKAAYYGSSALEELLEKTPMFRDFVKPEKETPGN